MRILKRTSRALIAALFAGSALFASAAELTIGLSAPITSLDPHYHNLTPNNALSLNVFEDLLSTDEFQNIKPGLAESWRNLDPLTYEFKLRKGVKWHDGSPFVAADVLASLKRVPNVPNSPASFAVFVRSIVEATAPDEHTVILKTAAPNPGLASDMTSVRILPKAIAESATTEDFNSGKAMIGTGPFKFSEYKPGDRVVLVRNDQYWGAKPDWTRVQMRMVANNATRVAALLAGDLQMIENVPTSDVKRLMGDKNLAVAQVVSNRLIYLHMDSNRTQNSPFVRTADGKPMENANPLTDPRVRRAMSMAINREAIVDRIMETVAVPAGQLLAEQFFGTSKNLKVDKYDPEGAKKLLAQAGYPNGFQLTLHSPNNRYINDEKIAQAIAQFLTRVGIVTKLETMPSNIFFTRASKLEFSTILAGWGASSGDTSSPLRSLLGTFDAKTGFGAANRGRFSNAELDVLIAEAAVEIDTEKRRAKLARASEKAIEQMGLIPLHYEVSVWATKSNVTYVARADQYTLAQEAKLKK